MLPILLMLFLCTATQAAVPSWCMYDGEHVQEGAQRRIPGQCSVFTCRAFGKGHIETCPRVEGVPLVEPDLSQPFPECCASSQTVSFSDIIWSMILKKINFGNLNVTYEEGSQASLRYVLTSSQVSEMPLVSYHADPGSYYSLVLFSNKDSVESDARRSLADVHWFVGNIPGSDVYKGEVVVDYEDLSTRLGANRVLLFVLLKQTRELYFTNQNYEDILNNGISQDLELVAVRPFLVN